MNLSKILLTGLLGAILGVLPDWLFGGVLFHDKYQAYPEVWRNLRDKGKESRAVMLSVLLSFLTFTGFASLYGAYGVHGWGAGFGLAVGIWVTAALPLLITNALFVKMHPAIVVSHCCGWLAKLGVAAVVSVLILR